MSTLFRLANGAKRSPDASWISTERWIALSKGDQKNFPPLCPDFLIELRSEMDGLDQLLAKMDENLSVGLRLGWLIDPLYKRVPIYRPNNTYRARVRFLRRYFTGICARSSRYMAGNLVRCRQANLYGTHKIRDEVAVSVSERLTYDCDFLQRIRR